MAVRGCLVLCVLLLAMADVGQADNVAIRYAEPFQLQLPSKTSLRTSKLSQSIVTHGRQFELELQSNEQLLASIGSARRAQLESVSLYKGRLRDRHDSWVRLTTIGDRTFGAIWDGIELYAIEPREDIEPRLQQPLVNRTARSLIYKLSDTEGGEDRICAVHGGNTDSRLLQYNQVVSELRASAAAALIPTTQIEIAIVGDYEFSTFHGFEAAAAMVARMNIVDGIFTEQVGIAIEPTDFIVFTSPSDPFTSSNSEELLGEFGGYRAASPGIRDRGLAHLMTGRDLNGNTVGVAYIGSLCEIETGVSLSEGGITTVDSALIVAHELGHNFGAPHDGEAACSAAPLSYLMAPYMNGSMSFSACSVERMQERASGASCLTPYRYADATVSVPGAPLQAVQGTNFSFPIEVSSTGEVAVRDLVVSVSLDSRIVPSSVSMPAADCSMNGNVVACRLAELAPGESLPMTIVATSDRIGQLPNRVTVSASNDDNSANNSVAFDVNVAVGADAIMSMSPEIVSAFTSSTTSVDIEVTSIGALALNDVSISVRVNGSSVTAASFGGTACDVAGSGANCMLSSIPPGQARILRLDLATGSTAGEYRGTVVLSATNDGNLSNDAFLFRVILQPSRQLDVQITPLQSQLLAGDEIVHTVQVASTGPQAVPDARLHMNSMGVMFESAIPSAGTCQVEDYAISCVLGALDPGEIATIELHSRGFEYADGRVYVYVESFVDDSPNDNHVFAEIGVRHQIDVGISSFGGDRVLEDEVSVYSGRVESFGLSAANNVTISASIPEALSIQTARFGQNDCEIVGNDITCRLSSPLEPGAEAVFDLTYVVAEPAVYRWPFTVSADGDASASNNTLDAYIHVAPYVDASISVDEPLPERIRIDESFVLEFSIETNHRPVSSQSALHVSGLERFTVESIEAPNASCSLELNRVDCQVAALEASTRTPFQIRLRGISYGPAAISIRHFAFDDANPDNNVLAMTTMLFREGDARVIVPQGIVSGTVNEWIDLPPISIAATRTIDNAILEIETEYRDDATPLIATQLHGYCSEYPAMIRCSLGVLEGGSSLDFGLRFAMPRAGNFAVDFRLTADNDVDPTNDAGTVSINIAPAPPPQPPAMSPGPSGGGGGGGGGAAGLPLLFVLLGMLLAYRSPGSIARRRC